MLLSPLSDIEEFEWDGGGVSLSSPPSLRFDGDDQRYCRKSLHSLRSILNTFRPLYAAILSGSRLSSTLFSTVGVT